MGMVRTVEGGADALDEFGNWQEASRLHYTALAMDPLGLNGVQPRRLDPFNRRRYSAVPRC